MNLAIGAAALVALVLVYESCARLSGPTQVRRLVGIVGAVSIVFAADRLEIAYGSELERSWVWLWLIGTVVWVIARAIFPTKPKKPAADPDHQTVEGGQHLRRDVGEHPRTPGVGRWAPIVALAVVFGGVVTVGVGTAPLVAAKEAAEDKAWTSLPHDSRAHDDSTEAVDEPADSQ